jgi:1,4-alpha-glucan branching enzyme
VPSENPKTSSVSPPTAEQQARAELDGRINALLGGRNADPFGLLGPHPVPGGWAIRFLIPWAAEASIVLKNPAHSPAKIADAVKIRPEGFFEVTWPSDQPNAPEPTSYRIQGRTHHGETFEIFDPYAFPFLLTDFDLHLMSEGRHYDTYEKLGAHLHTVAGVAGTHFAVWAPGARRVSVVGTMNGWDGRVHPLRPRGSSGIWELFLPEVGEGAIYKYEIVGHHGALLPLKADPYGFSAELRPKTGSVVTNLETHKWSDSAWLAERQKKNWLESPILVYEVHLGSWKRVPEDHDRWLTYRELADQLVPHRIAADHGAPIRWIVGVPDAGILRRDQPVRFAGRFHGICGPLPPGRNGRDSGLDSSAFSARFVWAGAI